MTPRGPDDHETSDLPDPPYSADLLADLHAGALPDPVAAHIRAHLAEDPAAQSILDALDRTVGDLRSAEAAREPVPARVRDDVAATLTALGANPVEPSIRQPAGFRTGSPPVTSAPVDITTARRGRRTATRLLLAAAAVVVVAAGSIGVSRLISASDSSPGPAPRAQSSAPAPTGPADAAVALTVLGRTDGAPFGSVEALRRCTAAHLVPATVVIVGSGRIVVDGSGAAAILLSTGVAGRFDALIVGLDCDLGNPSLISRGIVGG
ncbi:anti-sigma factor family protein [Gordonia terrae]|uniref:Anti-sigma-M factor RsmA n=2 Tax=Gordonia terrae TaxID=2055 RepID=A0AAD0KDB9_9ACTN|nr:hypothetical protein [Gordonia terrae]VTR08640.1 Uncharacterised protein [Clostridioides difficile]ANY25668.1 hypothetical protein BCM27_25220 [Gordonia terrae]AWO86413.1 hypothetical protein DLJ61_25480 [Gordonia terrae]VTS64329.1 Uncharacterised protein [Gordonia terrae]GAB44125.1 hypothetical protein GOTRE_060_00320 [Gordonia terrae NBRC 100016]